MSKFAQVQCDFCTDDGFWTVDAWKTDDDSEEGKVVAYIDDLTARVIYTDPLARVDPMTQETIRQKLVELEKNKVRVRDECGTMCLYLETGAGTLVAQAEREEGVGTDNMFVGIYPKDCDGSFFDINGVKVLTDRRNFLGLSKQWELRLLLYDDVTREDPRKSTWISDVEFQEVSHG